jgi:hypothetical protein
VSDWKAAITATAAQKDEEYAAEKKRQAELRAAAEKFLAEIVDPALHEIEAQFTPLVLLCHKR